MPGKRSAELGGKGLSGSADLVLEICSKREKKTLSVSLIPQERDDAISEEGRGRHVFVLMRPAWGIKRHGENRARPKRSLKYYHAGQHRGELGELGEKGGVNVFRVENEKRCWGRKSRSPGREESSTKKSNYRKSFGEFLSDFFRSGKRTGKRV